MGVSTDAILAFGIDIGEEIPEAIEALDLDDFDLDCLADHEGGLVWRADFTPEEENAYGKKARELHDAYPVELIIHCSYDYPMYIVAAKDSRYYASRGYSKTINPSDLKVKQEDIDALKAWCKKYNVEGEPEWLLFSMWG